MGLIANLLLDSAVDHFQSESNESRNSILKLLKADTPQNNQKAIPMIGDLNEAVEIIHDEHHWHGANNRDFNSFFPVVDGVRTPVRLVIGLLTLFVFNRGPINLYLLNRKDVRAWFLWTLPVISLLTSALVFVVSIFSEGVTPRVRTESVTILNQKEQEAVTLGGIGVYAPIAPGRLDFSGNSEVTPLIDSGKRDTGSGAQCHGLMEVNRYLLANGPAQEYRHILRYERVNILRNVLKSIGKKAHRKSLTA